MGDSAEPAGDGSFTRSPKSEWDIAAGTALILAAGGNVTDIDGRDVRFNQRSVKVQGLIASNRVLHPALAELAQKELTEAERAAQRRD